MRKYSSNRSGKIADQIHKDVVSILKHKVKDPRVGLVTIYEVEVDKNLAFATIYWNVLNTTIAIADVKKALESATGYIRSELSKGFKTYTIPQIKFIFDESIERGARILNLISQANTPLEKDD
jgi:ribosome-binding factor A